MSELELTTLEEQEYAKYIESIRASKRASKQEQSALALSRLILQESYQRGRYEMLRELVITQAGA